MAHVPITNWALEDRPREKLIEKGVESLSDAEIIAILIGSGNVDESAVELSKRILLSVDNNLNELSKMSIAKLKKFKGIGGAKAITIVAAMELGKRRRLSDVLNRASIRSSRDVFEIFYSILADSPHEEFWVLFLNNADKVLSKRKLSQGGLHSSVVDIKLILKLAVEQLASKIIVCHNHPAGNTKPSKQDIDVTQKLKKAASYLDVALLDHVIVGTSGYFSFLDEGFLI